MEINKSTKVVWSIKHETKFIYFCSSLNDFSKEMIDKGFDFMY
jgi:hypothetical protein